MYGRGVRYRIGRAPRRGGIRCHRSHPRCCGRTGGERGRHRRRGRGGERGGGRWRLTASREAGKNAPFELKTAEVRKFLGGLATVTADLAALNAFTAAVEAFASVGLHNEDFVAAARNDYDTLVHLQLGRYPEAGAPVDLSPGGPLGPL